MTALPAEKDQMYGPRRWGAVFALVWLFYLLNPLEAAWEQRDSVSGWVGMVATLAFGLIYATVFLLLRNRRTMGTPFRLPGTPAFGVAAVAGLIALGVVICVAVGQPGTATAVYIAVTCMICLPSRAAWFCAVAVA